MSALPQVKEGDQPTDALPADAPITVPSHSPPPVMSKELGELFGALCTAQATLSQPLATGSNEDLGTRHLTLAAVLLAARPALRDNGLCLIQVPAGNCLRTILGHKSGQFIQCDTPLLLGRDDLVPMQGLASAVSFARRIAATSMLAIAQPDDDGQSTATPGQSGRPTLGLVPTGAPADAASIPAARRGFSVNATIEAIKGKSTASELDDAKLRVEAAFSGDDLKAALDAIDERRRALGLTPT